MLTARPTLHVLHLIDHWGLGGAQRVVANLAGSDPDNTHSVWVLYGHGAHDWGLSNVRCFGDRYPDTLMAIWRLRLALRNVSCDLVQVHLHGVKIVCHLIGAFPPGLPVIWHEHTAGEYRSRFGSIAGGAVHWLLRRFRNKPRLVIANSESTALFCREHLLVEPRRVRVLACPIRFDQIREQASEPLENCPEGLDLEHRILGFVGRLADQKDPLAFVRAIAPILRADDDVQAWILGDGPLEAAVIKMVRKLGLADRILIWGRRSDVYAIMARMDVIVIPSKYEPFGLVAREGFALGISVVGFDVDGLGDQLRSSPLGESVPAGDIGALRQAIRDRLSWRDHPDALAGDDASEMSGWRALYREFASLRGRD